MDAQDQDGAPVAAEIVEGNIDQIIADNLQLWCWYPLDPNRRVTVDLLVGNHLFGRYVADEYRSDLVAAGKGDGHYGLTINLTGLHRTSPAETVTFSAFAADTPDRPFSTFQVQPTFDGDIDLAAGLVDHVRHHVLRLANAVYGQSRVGWGPAKVRTLNGTAAAPLVDASAIQGTGPRRLAISKYASFTRQRMREEEHFNLAQASIETDNYLKWYIELYSMRRSAQRAPLSAAEIAYLNELIIVGGQHHHLSRITWMFLLDEPGMLSQLNLKSADSFIGVAYWWANEKSRSLWVEDCLVHNTYIQALGAVGERWRVTNYPLSRFMELYFHRRVDWHFLNLEHEQDRAIFNALLLLAALQQPSILQYIPRTWINKFVFPREGKPTLLARLIEQVLDDSPARRYIANYDRAVAECGFDLIRGRSLSVTTEGHRLANFGLVDAAASLNPVSIQVIGPLHKASGLGQATRLSFDALMRRFPDCSGYDFDMDNPAPVGFNPERPVSPLRRAKVNLIHLNAESIPLAFAYLPDVFTEAYNIGYFFWELNTPATCHSLALDLLDEVWVSSEYGLDQYVPVSSIPVTKVGMSFEDVAVPLRRDAREFTLARLGFTPNCFIFLAAFDSFSFIQRKNPQSVVRAFLDAFPEEPRARLVLKTHNRHFVHDPVQQKIWQFLDEVVSADPRIVILNETLPYEQLIRLKVGCDCYVSLHRSEGWGFGMLEAMHLGIPVLATNYSGNTDFCSADTAWTVDYAMTPIGGGDYIFVKPGQVWAEPDHADAVRQMRSVFGDGVERENRIACAKRFVDLRYSPEAVAQRYADRLHQIEQDGTLLRRVKGRHLA